MALRGTGHRRADRGRRDVSRQARIDAGDDRDDDPRRVLPTVGWASPAAGRSVPIAVGHRPGVAAGRAGLPPGAADAAVPVLAAPLQRAQRLAARGTDRRGDVRRPRRAQRDEQIPDHPRRRGPALTQQRRPIAEGLGQAPPLGPAPRHAPHGVLDHRAVQRRFHLGDQVNDDADRVRENLGRVGVHR